MKSLVTFYLLLVLKNTIVSAVTCGNEFSTRDGEGTVTNLFTVNNIVHIDIDVHETTAVGDILYFVDWTDTATQTSISEAEINDGLPYIEYKTNLTASEMSVNVRSNGSMAGLVDYNDPSKRMETLTLTIYVDFDGTLCKLLLTHNLVDDNTQDPHMEMESYRIEIREDFPVFLPIPGLQPSAFDFDASYPNNMFSVYFSYPECPLRATMENYTCTTGEAVFIEFELVTGLNYDTMESPYETVCTATLQDFGEPTRTATSEITIVVSGFHDENPQFSAPYYKGTLDSVEVGTVVSTEPTINATDQDVPPTSVSYSMIAADVSTQGMEYFSIDSVTAEISIIKLLDSQFLALQQVPFLLTATDIYDQAGQSYINIVLPPGDLGTTEGMITTEVIMTDEPTTCPVCPSCPTENPGFTDPITTEITCPDVTCDPCDATCLPCPSCPTWNTGFTDSMTTAITCPAVTCDPCDTTCLPCDNQSTTDWSATYSDSTIVTEEPTTTTTTTEATTLPNTGPPDPLIFYNLIKYN